MKFEVKHRVTGAILFSLETKSLKLCLEAAVKEKANLRWADLSVANLSGAYLSGACLAAQLGQPNGWHAWTYVSKDGEQRVRVGCRDYTITEGRAYWAGKDNRLEVLAALDYAERIAELRGWKKLSEKKAA